MDPDRTQVQYWHEKQLEQLARERVAARVVEEEMAATSRHLSPDYEYLVEVDTIIRLIPGCEETAFARMW
eukprot:6762636-Pyramimonas_sp.AAC.1